MIESKVMYVEDENGNEKEMEILFTFDNKEKKYVLFKDAKNDTDEIFASCYDDEGTLTPIETQAEWDMVEEVLGAFIEEEENAED